MMSEPLSIKPDSTSVLVDYATVVALGQENPAHFKFSGLVAAPIGSWVQSRVPAVTFHSEPVDSERADVACRISMENGVDLIGGIGKGRDGITYFYGVPADKLKAFAPIDAKPIDEASMWVTMKFGMSQMVSIDELLNTEAVKFKSLLDAVLARSPTFIAEKLSSVAAIEKSAKNSFSVNIKAAVTKNEKVARQQAKEKASNGSDQAEESAGGGQEVGARWAEIRENLLSHAQLDLPFEQRFIYIDTKQSQEEAKEQLKGHPFEEQLVNDLPEYYKYMAGELSALSGVQTVFSELLLKASLKAAAPAPDSDANAAGARARKPPATFQAGDASSKRKQGAAEGGAAAAKKARGRPAKAALHAEGKENASNGARITSKQAEALYKDLDKLRKGVPTGI